MTDTELWDALEAEFMKPDQNPPSIEYRDADFTEQGRWWVAFSYGYKMITRGCGEGQTLREALTRCIEDTAYWEGKRARRLECPSG